MREKLVQGSHLIFAPKTEIIKETAKYQQEMEEKKLFEHEKMLLEHEINIEHQKMKTQQYRTRELELSLKLKELQIHSDSSAATGNFYNWLKFQSVRTKWVLPQNSNKIDLTFSAPIRTTSRKPQECHFGSYWTSSNNSR
jgi:hypothetical protein